MRPICWTGMFGGADYGAEAMKCYYYGEPSYTLTKAVFAAKAKARWLRFPAALAMVLVWALLMPWAWLAIRAGEAGHRVAGWCGFNSRNW